MNRTLLVEEGDDDGNNRQEKKKREKEKFPDTAEKKKKMAFKKADGKKEHNNSLTSSSKVQPAEMVDMAAVNPDTEGITSPVGSPAVNLPGTNVYPGNVVIPPPPRPVTLQQLPPQHLQQRANWPQQQQQMAAVYVVPTQQPHFIPAAFQSPGPPPQQIVAGQFVAQPYQQGHFAVPQYHQAGGTPVQGVVYSGQIVAGPHTHVLTRAQSLPSSAAPGGEQAHSSGWVGQPSTSPPPLNNAAESSWAANHAAEPREERTWREGENSANGNNTQWAAFSPDDSSHNANMWSYELDEEHSSSDEDVDRSSSPELAGEEGEVLLRAPSLASFAESISSLEEESEDNVWRILPEQREYYTKQFKRLQPAEDGVVKGPRARDFFMKSSLPVEVLSKIWQLSDINKDNALNLDEFCIAMHLVVALRHGLELPSTLPAVLLPVKKEAGVGIHPLETSQQKVENVENEVRERVSSPEHWYHFSGSHSHDATSPPANFSNSAVRKKAHSVVQPIPQRGDIQGDEDTAARPRSLSDPTSLEDSATDGPAHRNTNLAGPKPVNPLHIVMPQSPAQQAEALQTGPTSPSQAVTAEIEIARPRAVIKPSLLDARPGQLLPPPSGKQAREGWTPTSKFIYQGHGPSSSPPSSPEEDTPTSPLSPDGLKTPSPPPLAQEEEEEERPKEDDGKEEVVYRVNRRSGERPRSTGDVKINNKNESSLPSTPVDEEGPSSVSSEGKKDPPPPPPRNKKGHSRSSSLDLNKLFATKAKENRGTPPSSSSSFSSQTGDSVPPAKSEPSTPRHKDESSTGSKEKIEENHTKVEKQEDFADFSRFESFVESQGERRRGSSPRPGQHRRSFSLDHSREVVWSQPPPAQKPPSEAATTPSRPPHNQEALPRPVPKLKPPSPPTLKQGRRLDKDGEKERKLKTEPPKVIVRPLTKEDKLNSRINDLKEKNAALSKVNSELQEDLKTIMESRASLEIKLEKLKSPSSQKHETAIN
ncbi:uncharacterized protein LOC144658558 isoform X2 [Oculina patagonica]